MHRILIVDDDQNLRGVLVKALNKAGLMATWAENGAAALELHRAHPADLIVLDLMMPKMDGFEVLKALRPRDEVPVLMLTAEGQERKRVEGFRLGADDYLVKPFSMQELLGRIRAILKRTSRHKEPKALCSGPFELDRMNQRLLREGVPVDLTHMEYHILNVLMSHPGQPLTRMDLLRLAWTADSRPSPRTVDVHMFNLRRKIILEQDPKWILTTGSHGYAWTVPIQEKA